MTAWNIIDRLALLGVVTVLPTAHESAQTSDPASPAHLPVRLEQFIDTVIRPTVAERKRLLDGAPITKFLDTDPVSEVALFGAIWISAAPRRYVQAVQVIQEGAEETVVASKMLYAGHYFWTGLELRVLIPDPSRTPGFWFVNVQPWTIRWVGRFHGFHCSRSCTKPGGRIPITLSDRHEEEAGRHSVSCHD